MTYTNYTAAEYFKLIQSFGETIIYFLNLLPMNKKHYKLYRKKYVDRYFTDLFKWAHHQREENLRGEPTSVHKPGSLPAEISFLPMATWFSCAAM